MKAMKLTAVQTASVVAGFAALSGWYADKAVHLNLVPSHGGNSWEGLGCQLPLSHGYVCLAICSIRPAYIFSMQVWLYVRARSLKEGAREQDN